LPKEKEIMSKQSIIIGCGYVGQRLAQRLLQAGLPVLALARSEQPEKLRQLGLAVVRGDLDGALPALSSQGTLLYYLAPPPGQGSVDSRLAGFLRHLESYGLPARMVLISTTGVYGDCGGDWVDESRRLNPQSDRARRRADAEQRCLQWSAAHGVDAMILRVPGIYGPQRLPEARLRQATPVLAEEQSPFSNRIHVDDLVTCCLAAIDRGQAGAAYHVSDGNPSTMSGYFNQVADALGLPRPPVIDWEQARQQFSAEMQSYLSESRRLDIRRMREELRVEPAYPMLESGLAQCLREQAAEL
jgi:nucleoside-diphosphate-sugar epimerase